MNKADEVREQAASFMYHAEGWLAPCLMAWECVRAAAALRAYADLLEEREREERLLRADGRWELDFTNGLYRWAGHRRDWRLSIIYDEDRATAARLAEEKLNESY